MTLRIRQIVALTLSLVLVMAVGVMVGKGSDPTEPRPMVMTEGMGCPACHLSSEVSLGCAQFHCTLPVADQAEYDRRMPGGGVVFADPASLLHQTSHRPSPRPA